MEKIGVEAIVEGLVGFVADMKKVDDSIAGVIPTSSLLGRTLTGLGDIVGWLTGSIFNVLEYTLGSLLSEAIQFVIGQINELIGSVIEAGNEFQTLEIRLINFNKNALMSRATEEYIDVTKEAVAMTKEQLTWLQKLAVATPYDATDIANVYTLARSYSFADDEARTLTESISNFAAGMGLSEVEIRRIIVNFGQMAQQGKVTQRELNDLARGAFVPVNDILKIMQDRTGLAGDEFDKFRNSGEGVNMFMEAFLQLVETRFAGATEAMAQTWKGATDNARDFFQSVLGLQVVKPVLDTLGKSIAQFVSSFTEPARWEAVTAAAKRIGDSLSGIVTDLLGMGGGADLLADKTVTAFQRIADWLERNRDGIVKWVQDAVKRIRDFLVPALQSIGQWIQNTVIPAFNRISDWYQTHKDGIFTFFVTLGDIIKTVFADLTGNMPTGDILGSVLQGVTDFMAYVIANKEKIIEWVEILIKAYAIFQGISLVLGIVGAAFVSLVTIVAEAIVAWWGIQSVIAVVGPVLTWVGGIIAAIGAPILILIGLVALLGYMWWKYGEEIKVTTEQLFFIISYYWKKFWEETSVTFSQAWFIIKYYFQQIWNSVTTYLKDLWTSIVNAFTQLKTSLSNMVSSWKSIGTNMINAMAEGIRSGVGKLIDAAKRAAQSAYNAALSALGISSPSKLFLDIGHNVMQAFASGITETAAMTARAMKDAAALTVGAGMSAPAQMYATAAPSSVSTVNNTNQFNLSIQSSANTEPIIQDFEMMKSMM